VELFRPGSASLHSCPSLFKAPHGLHVVLELGYFLGRLGRDRVCASKRGDVEIPSDIEGVVYVPFDASGAWKQALGKELQAAGFEIDWNKVMRG
jgi:predicted nucleotide-binding protein